MASQDESAGSNYLRTPSVIATSGPSSDWPRKAYRNPTDQLVKFLDYKHGQNWAIFEFRAEGTGYPDSEVYNRIHHFPWPDHHPPPFALIPNLMASMRNWLRPTDPSITQDNDKTKRRVVVVHCKAGKGRSGTVACSYLISQEGWNRADALRLFTERRMRVGFGEGVSIPSQLRWVGYVDRWTNNMNKKYVERSVEVVELHVWGLRDGVKVAVEGYIEDGKQIKTFHTFHREEKIIIDKGDSDAAIKSASVYSSGSITSPTSSSNDSATNNAQTTGTTAVLFKPAVPIFLPTSDINIDFERRNTANYTGWTMVTSLAHVWFNAYFEGGREGADSGVFEIGWDAMDGIKGSAKKGIKALDRLRVLWRYAKQDGLSLGKVITEPAPGEPVPELKAADWKGAGTTKEDEVEAKKTDEVSSGRTGGSAFTMGAAIGVGAESPGKELGLRKETPESTNISRAGSVKDDEEPAAGKSSELEQGEKESEEDQRVKPHSPNGEETILP